MDSGAFLGGLETNYFQFQFSFCVYKAIRLYMSGCYLGYCNISSCRKSPNVLCLILSQFQVSLLKSHPPPALESKYCCSYA